MESDDPYANIPQSEIDWDMLRKKWIGRLGVFYNEQNAGGKTHRREAFQIPDIIKSSPLVSPNVNYRIVGEDAYQDFLQTGGGSLHPCPAGQQSW